ncbi:hypothetical protein OHA77_03295 [Streptosporangium sp. NBC_01639]|uniref:hypothetical protein n=1 Tax=Streptosporangium sp. NBC_01639 TaxID=2975948 RepID=UPI003870AE90|nr:hypothetical protein OHA77_03295 [Streptosporangium sp. NBC_01639]
MISLCYGLVATLQIFLAVRLWRTGERIPAVVGAAMAYDAAVIGLGVLVGAGAFLEGLNRGRFLGHALLTPLLALYAARLWHRLRPLPRQAWVAVAVAVVALVALGVAESPRLLEVRRWADTVRYAAADPPGPPIPALLTMAALVAVGVLVWRGWGSPLLLAGAVAMFVLSAGAVAVPILGNVGEAVVLAVILATERLPSSRAPHAGSGT